MNDFKHPHLVRSEDVPRAEEEHFAHPLNDASDLYGVSLSERVGLRRIGVHRVRVPPGKEAFIYHSHAVEEEFVYILEGRGVAEIAGEEFEVGPGDFMGFPAPSVPHHLKNPNDSDLVYLMGGERREVEIAEFPRLGKHLVRTGREAFLVDSRHLQSFWKADADD